MDKENEVKTQVPISEQRALHMIGVANYMYEHAEERGLPKDDMYILGLLHDIGYLHGQENHEFEGKKIIFDFGMRSHKYFTYGYVIANHGKVPDKKIDSETRSIQKLLAEADFSIDFDGRRCSYDERLEGIALRHGKDSDRYKQSAKIIRWLKSGK